jgi:hypothetical protein
VWTGVGGKKKRRKSRRTSGPSQAQIRSYQALTRREEVAQRAAALAGLESALVSAHREAFEPAQPATADSVEPVDEAAIQWEARREALQGISWFAFSQRREAKHDAQAWAERRVAEEQERRLQARAEGQAELDREWHALCANEPGTVLEHLEEAFEDNQAPAVPIDCDGDGVSIVVICPAVESMPTEKAAVTPSGRPTVHNRTQTERNALHAQSVSSTVLVTVREAFAVAPAIRRVTMLAVVKTEAVGGTLSLAAVAAAGFDRRTIDNYNWTRLDALATLQAGTPSLLNPKGRTQELAPLDLHAETEIGLVLAECAKKNGGRFTTRRTSLQPADRSGRCSRGLDT